MPISPFGLFLLCLILILTIIFGVVLIFSPDFSTPQVVVLKVLEKTESSTKVDNQTIPIITIKARDEFKNEYILTNMYGIHYWFREDIDNYQQVSEMQINKWYTVNIFRFGQIADCKPFISPYD